MTENKELYQQMCEQEDIPLFLQYNWFNTLYKGSDWNVAVEQKGGNVVGILPYVVTKKKSFKVITPQFLSPYQGVWIKYPAGQKYASKVGFEKEVINGLIEQISKVDAFKQNFLPGFTNWMPFNWKGYEQSTRYTYIINDISDTDKVFGDFKENIRREIRKAEKVLRVEVTEDIDLVFQMKLKVYEANNDNYPIPLSKLKLVYDYCKANNCGELLVAKDSEGNIHSILLYVWDNLSAYYLHGVTDSKYKTSGSMSLLLWEAIKKSATKTKAFNFEGSMVESIERYFRGFGGKQTPYFQISKTDSKVLKLLNY
ncbi:MAG: methicillin resistance protein [Flavobacteriales bacterium]|nr:MAG: methicillin resistance protein [Flavobacteriales bacterium]